MNDCKWFVIIVCFLAMYSTYAMEEKAEGKKRKFEEIEEIGTTSESEKKQKLSEEEGIDQARDLLRAFINAITKGDKEFINKYLKQYSEAPENASIKKVISAFFNRSITLADKNVSATLLTLAIIKHQFEIAKLILDSGVMTLDGLNVQDNNGNTVLMWAIHEGQTELAKDLIKKGSDLNIKNKTGDTALREALVKEQFDIAKLMIENKDITLATLNAPDSQGITPLMAAIQLNQFALAQLLVEKGVNLDLTNKEGLSSLFALISNNAAETALLVIEKGANINLEYKDRAPLYYASGRYNRGKLDPIVVKALLTYNGGLGNKSVDQFKNNKVLMGLFNAIDDYKTSVKDEKASALYDAIVAENSPFTKYGWLRLAILRNDEIQIKYCVTKNTFTADDVYYLSLYLKEIRQKTPKQLIQLVNDKKYSAFDVIYSLVNTQLAMFIGIVPQLLEMVRGETITTSEEKEIVVSAAQKRNELLQAAKERNNKKLIKKIVEFNNILSGFRNKKQTVFLSEEDIEKKIASYLV